MKKRDDLYERISGKKYVITLINILQWNGSYRKMMQWSISRNRYHGILKWNKLFTFLNISMNTVPNIISPELSSWLPSFLDIDRPKTFPIVGIATWSDSDFASMNPLFDTLRDGKTPFLVQVASAHRTAERMRLIAQNFPKVHLSIDEGDSLYEKCGVLIRDYITNCLRIKFFIAGAGGSSHLWGMLAAFGRGDALVLALSIVWSSLGQLDSILSNTRMPGGVAIGNVGNANLLWSIANTIYVQMLTKSLTENNSIYTDPSMSSEDAWEVKRLVELFWLKITNNPNDTPVWIYNPSIEWNTPQATGSQLSIFALKHEKNEQWPKAWDIIARMPFVPGIVSGIDVPKKGKTSAGITNSVIIAAQILAWQKDGEPLRASLRRYHQNLSSGVARTNIEVLLAQAQAISDAFKSL